MAESKTERDYIVPLRQSWIKKVRYKRTRASVMAIKEFVARHMKVPDRDISKVKLDTYLNNELWFRGARKPPAKVKVHVKRDGDFVLVTLAETPELVKFAQKRQEKRHKPATTKKAKKEDSAQGASKTEEKKDDKSEDEKKAESEKEKSVAAAGQQQAQQTAKAQKHTVQTQKTPQVQRKALKK